MFPSLVLPYNFIQICNFNQVCPPNLYRSSTVLHNSYLRIFPCMSEWVKVTQWCLTLCNHMDYRLPSSSVHGFSRQKHCSGLPFPSPGGLPNPGIEPRSPSLQADSLPSEPPGKPIYKRWKKIQGTLYDKIYILECNLLNIANDNSSLSEDDRFSNLSMKGCP